MTSKFHFGWCTVVMLLCLAFSVQAQPQRPTSTDFQVGIEQPEPLKVSVTCDKAPGKKLKLVVKKQMTHSLGYSTDEILFEDEIAATATHYGRVLNFEKLENGTYEIEVRGGGKRFVKRIEIQTVTEQLPRAIKVAE